MNKTMVTEQQIELLKEAYLSTLGTTNYHKYSCALSFKSKKTGKWILSIYSSPAYINNNCYFKKVRGDLYIYSADNDERVLLNSACKELLGLAA